MLANLNAIVAACDDWGIGLNGDMIVRNRADMQHFVAHTTGHAVLMGRRTLESFPGAKPLKNRRNIVLTRDASYAPQGVEIAHSLEEALELAGTNETWVIGGGQIYRDLLPHCAKVIVTKNHCIRPADTFFPNLDQDPEWEQEIRVQTDEQGSPLATPEGIAFEFVTYKRVAGA